MAFIQIIDAKTSRSDEITALEKEWEAATEGRRTVRRSIRCSDRNDPDRIVILAFFDSYESAMENSKLPETQAFAAKWGELADGEPTFLDLDVVEDRAR